MKYEAQIKVPGIDAPLPAHLKGKKLTEWTLPLYREAVTTFIRQSGAELIIRRSLERESILTVTPQRITIDEAALFQGTRSKERQEEFIIILLLALKLKDEVLLSYVKFDHLENGITAPDGHEDWMWRTLDAIRKFAGDL